MSAKPIKAEKELSVKVNFPETGSESKFFNGYDFRRHDVFIFMRLWYVGPDSQGWVFSGSIYRDDALQLLPPLKTYVPKLGHPVKFDLPSPPQLQGETPTSFQHLAMAFRGEIGEIAVGVFSHRMVADATRKKAPSAKGASDQPALKGYIHGLYCSTSAIHQRLVLDFIKTVESQ